MCFHFLKQIRENMVVQHDQKLFKFFYLNCITKHKVKKNMYEY